MIKFRPFFHGFCCAWAGLHHTESVTWPLLVALMVTRMKGITQPALEWGYLLTNLAVPTANAIERISRCSKTPGLAKSRAGGCLTVDLMNREKSDTILTYAWSDAVLHSCAFEFCSCLQSFPSYCCCYHNAFLLPFPPPILLNFFTIWGEISSLVLPSPGLHPSGMCAAVTNQLRCKKPTLSSKAGWHLRQLSSCWEVIAKYKPCPYWSTESTPCQHKPWQKARECTDVFMSNAIPLKFCPLLVSPGALGRHGKEWC